MATEFQGCAITERDANSDVLVTWIYPTLPAALRRVAEHSLPAPSQDESADAAAQLPPQRCGRAAGSFYYVVTADGSALNIHSFSVLVWSSEFHPEKYYALAELLAGQYTAANGQATALLTLLLAAFVRGKIKKAWVADSFGSALSAAPVKSLWNTFNLETIVLYVAVLLKRRVAVIGTDASNVVDLSRALAALAPHRNDTNILFPNLDFTDDEELARLPKSYIFGGTDAALDSRHELYDVVANATNGTITIAPHAEEDFAMGRVHKNIATVMVELAQRSEATDAEVLQELERQTQELLGALDKLSTADDTGRKTVTIDAIQSRKMPSSMHRFLINLATAEGMLSV